MTEQVGSQTESTALAAFSAALVRAQGKVDAVVKSKDGYVGKFASTEAIIIETREALWESDLSVVTISQALLPGYDIESLTKEGKPFTQKTYMLASVYRVSHAAGHSVDMAWQMAVIPERGKPLDKAMAAACTFSLGYFLRGLLLLPRVGVGEEVNLRNDDAFNPERATLDELVKTLAMLKAKVTESRYAAIVTTPPTSVEDYEVRVTQLLAEVDRQASFNLFKGLLNQSGYTDKDKTNARLAEVGLPSLIDLWTGSHDQLRAAMDTWKDILAHERAKA